MLNLLVKGLYPLFCVCVRVAHVTSCGSSSPAGLYARRDLYVPEDGWESEPEIGLYGSKMLGEIISFFQNWREIIPVVGSVAAGILFWIYWERKERNLEKRKAELQQLERYINSERERLREKENQLRMEFAKLANLRNQREKLTKEVDELTSKLIRLQFDIEEYEKSLEEKQREFERLSEIVETLERDIRELRKVKKRLEEGIDQIIKGAERMAHENLITELRSLRAQKSAILGLFEKYPELEEFLRKKEGVGIRKFLERAKKVKVKSDSKGV